MKVRKVSSTKPKKNDDSADGSDKTYKFDKQPNTNGTVPFKRMIVLWIVFIILSAALSPLIWGQYLFSEPPADSLDPAGMAGWILRGIILPHLIIYILVMVVSYTILPQSSWRYARWLTWESMGKHIISFALLEFIFIFVVMAAMLGLPYQSFYLDDASTSPDRMTNAATMLWNVSILGLVIPAWVSYSTSWKSYRTLGALSMQDRYEEHLRVTEIKNSGQMWDYMTKVRIPRVLGIDGNSPRGLFALFAVTGSVMYLVMSLGLILELSILYGFALVGIIPIGLSIHAAIAKRRDGKMSLKRPQKLVVIRGPDSIDEYNPSHTGVRQFDRS